MGNQTDLVEPNPSTVSEATSGQAGEVIAAFEYTVNAAGLRVQMRAEYGWRKPSVVTETYAYDPLRRLTGVTDSEGFQATYEYDAAGNRTRWWANDDQTTQRPRDGFETTYTYDAADRLLEALRESGPPEGEQRFVYAYDANGNRTNLNWPGPPGPNTQGLDYAYDREDRLVVAQAYQTNHQGQRVEREITRLYYDGQGRRLAKEYDPKTSAAAPSPASGEGRGGGLKRTEYVFDNLDPVVEYALWNGQHTEYYRGEGAQLLTMRHFPAGAEGQSYWYHHDGRGSVAGLTKHEGQSTHNYRYDAYGQLLPAKGNWSDPHNHYTFSGKEWDEHLDSYEFGYRLYDPAAGLWLTRDPLRGEPQRPRTLHRYAYAFASPISYRDAYGLQGGGGGGFGTVIPESVPVPTPLYTPTPTPTPSRAPTPTGAQCDPTNWYAPLQPNKYTRLPRFLDWLAQPWLHIVPKAQFELGRDGVMRLRFSNMVSDMELELGIKNQVRTSTGSPWLVTTSGVREYLLDGRAWVAAGNGEVSMGSQGAAVSTGAGGLTVSAQAWTATSVNGWW